MFHAARMPNMECISSFDDLLFQFQRVFTGPTFPILVSLMMGWVLSHRRRSDYLQRLRPQRTLPLSPFLQKVGLGIGHALPVAGQNVDRPFVPTGIVSSI
jgi:hypothetical protein